MNIRSGLAWLLLNADIATHAIFESQDTVYADDRQHFDIRIDGGRPAVYMTSERVGIITPEQPTRFLSTPPRKALDLVSEALSFPKSNAFPEGKLALALALYSAYYTEQSANARFLTLVMVLEALAPELKRTCLVLTFRDKWRKEIAELMEKVPSDSDEHKALEAQRGELSRPDETIGRRIRTLVIQTLQGVPGVDVKQSVKTADYIYNKRSRLVHCGTLDAEVLASVTTDAESLVRLILRTLFMKAMDAAKRV